MKTKLLALFLLAGSSLFAGVRIGVGIGFGPGPGYYAAPPPPARYVYAAPACPAPGYAWVGGYWYPSGARYYWHAGYWARPPYAGDIGSLRAITVITTIEVIGAARPLVVSQIRWHDLNLGNSNPRVKFCN